MDVFDGALSSTHSRAYVHTLEGRARSARARHEPAVCCKNYLAVGTDVDENGIALAVLQVADVSTCNDVSSDVCGNRRQAVQPCTRRSLKTNVRSPHVLRFREYRGKRSFAYRRSIHSDEHVHHRAVGTYCDLVDLISADAESLTDGTDHLVDGADDSLSQLDDPVLRMLDLVSNPCQDVEAKMLLRVDLRCVSELFACVHVDERAYDGSRSDIYGDTESPACGIPVLEPGYSSLMKYRGILARLHRIDAECCVVHSFSAGLLEDLVLERGLVVECRLVDRYRHLGDVCSEFKVRKIARCEYIVLLLLLERLDLEVSFRIDKTAEPDTRLDFFLLEYSEFRFRYITGIAFKDPDFALSADAFASACIVNEDPCAEHEISERLSRCIVDSFAFRHYRNKRHYIFSSQVMVYYSTPQSFLATSTASTAFLE